MNEFLNNPWVTGIGGGIISSFIVFFATKFFLTKKENKEYLQKVETANNELLYSIRPLIIEKKIPSKEIISSVKFSTAKKYGVKPEDLYNDVSLSNDLINEILSNSFLSSDQKLEFCNLLQTIQNSNNITSAEKPKYIYIDNKSSSTKFSSLLLATTTFAMVLTVTLFFTKNAAKMDTVLLFEDKFSIVSLITLIPILAIIFLTLFKTIKEKEIEKQRISEFRKMTEKLKRNFLDNDEKNNLA